MVGDYHLLALVEVVLVAMLDKHWIQILLGYQLLNLLVMRQVSIMTYLTNVYFIANLG